jgi:predicted metal-binding membrane protein
MASAVVAPPRLSAGALAPVVIAVALAWAGLALVPLTHDGPSFAVMWLAMTIAMMVPTVMRPMRRAAAGSLPRAWTFLAGFVAVWLAAGVPAFMLMGAITWTPAWLALAWMAAGAYQLTPLMRRTLRDCRSVVFDGRPLAYGVRQGQRCVISCGPVMIAVMVTAMSMPSAVVALVPLVIVTVAICWEKSPRTSARRVAAVGVAVLLLGAGGFVLAGGQSGTAHHSSGTSTS